MTALPTITCDELKQRLDAGDKPFILDVREPEEYETCNLGGTLIPLEQLGGRLTELPRDREIIVHCKAGGRSARAVELLRQKGFKNAKNLDGGIMEWRSRIDSSLQAY